MNKGSPPLHMEFHCEFHVNTQSCKDGTSLLWRCYSNLLSKGLKMLENSVKHALSLNFSVLRVACDVSDSNGSNQLQTRAFANFNLSTRATLVSFDEVTSCIAEGQYSKWNSCLFQLPYYNSVRKVRKIVENIG